MILRIASYHVTSFRRASIAIFGRNANAAHFFTRNIGPQFRDLLASILGCSFAPRCRFSEDRCSASMPPEFAPTLERMTRCLRVAGREIDLGGPNLSERNTSRP